MGGVLCFTLDSRVRGNDGRGRFANRPYEGTRERPINVEEENPMNVQELIEILGECPQEMRVVVQGYEDGYDDLARGRS